MIWKIGILVRAKLHDDVKLRSATEELLSSSIAESSPADQGGSEVEESMVDVGASFPSNGPSTVLVQQGEGLFDDPAAGGDFVAGAAASDIASDMSLPQFGIHARVVVSFCPRSGS